MRSRIRQSFKIVLALTTKICRTLIETLREIFDESAYSRFLLRTGLASSQQSYAAFRQEFEQAKMRRPKCC
jgi:hypothetical protein